MALPPDWRTFIESLNSHGVEYVVVGAVALAQHGFPRYTGDIDVLVRNSPENAQHIEQALTAFGMGSLGLKAADFTGTDSVIQFGVPPVRIDILTACTGVPFAQAWSGRVTVEVDGISMNVIGREDLILNKRLTGRPQDLVDIELLQNPRS
jgi:hypothetical protein